MRDASAPCMTSQAGLGEAREGTKRVREVMRRDFVAVAASESLDEARRIMRLARLRHLLVERDGILAGVLSYRDLQDEALAHQTGPPVVTAESSNRPMRVAEAMMRSPYAVTPETDVANAAARMFHLRIGCLPVVERTPQGPRLVGLISESDLLRIAYPS